MCTSVRRQVATAAAADDNLRVHGGRRSLGGGGGALAACVRASAREPRPCVREQKHRLPPTPHPGRSHRRRRYTDVYTTRRRRRRRTVSVCGADKLISYRKQCGVRALRRRRRRHGRRSTRLVTTVTTTTVSAVHDCYRAVYCVVSCAPVVRLLATRHPAQVWLVPLMHTAVPCTTTADITTTITDSSSSSPGTGSAPWCEGHRVARETTSDMHRCPAPRAQLSLIHRRTR